MIPCVIDPDLHFDDKRAPEAARLCRACRLARGCHCWSCDWERRGRR